MKQLHDKIILITGAGGGIGAATARLFAQHGAILILTDINEDVVKQVADSLGTRTLALAHDVADENSWESVIDQVRQQFGRLDVLVNNAGILHVGDVVHTSLADWQRVQRINSDGVFLGCKHAMRLLEQSGGGAIINMSSNSANVGVAGFCAYSASKGAVRSLTKNVAAYCCERKRGVRCNSVHPKGVATPMITRMFDPITDEQLKGELMGKLCQPEDIAPLLLFLASDHGKLANGAEFTIDDGEAMHFKA